MLRRLRLRSQAFGNSAYNALCGQTFVTTNTPWCCPWIASATISSAPPSPYISAVSIKLMPSSIPKRSAATSLACALLLSPMRHVPCPSTGTRLPSDSATVLISIQSHLESTKAEVTFDPETFTPASPIKEWTYGESWPENRLYSADGLRGTGGSRFL